MMAEPSSPTKPNTCTYSTYKWNVNTRKVVDYKTVQKPYGEITDVEIDSTTGCTVCREDQQAIKIDDLPAVLICKKYAQQLEAQLRILKLEGEPILKLVGYRVGMTRGDVDAEGNRTQFSNHSFGIALDINDEQNGLYDQCLEFSDQCRLRKGGAWNENTPGSLTSDSLTVIRMKQLGFKWGGEIHGWQKDFMHFSPSGY
jgi:hypothetical protein